MATAASRVNGSIQFSLRVQVTHLSTCSCGCLSGSDDDKEPQKGNIVDQKDSAKRSTTHVRTELRPVDAEDPGPLPVRRGGTLRRADVQLRHGPASGRAGIADH